MKTVFVGLSGGVDSAVSAALLKEEGYRVVGVFIKIWQPEFIECTWREDRLDAMRIAAALQIPFREIDLSNEYKKSVIVDMIDGYAQGSTPNPDILCNQHIKFGAFAEWAFKEGADFVATGHYARLKKTPELKLLRAKDVSKDQTYFLSLVDPEVLKKSIFPIGELLKSEVRQKAEEFGLPVSTKPDSQGLCFVGEVSIAEFLGRFIPVSRGDVLNEEGTVIGTHEGAALYTIGQRHGFNVPGNTTDVSPLYIISIDTKKNTLVVSRDRLKAAHSQFVLAPHWINGPPSSFSGTIQCRYHGEEIPAHIEIHDSKAQVTCEKPIIAAPGQTMVFYEHEEVVGGGIIEL